MYKNSIFIFLAALVVIVFSITACRTARRPTPGYGWVPVESALASTSENQKLVLSSDGPPHVVWITPSMTVIWIYCQDGFPTRVVEFGEQVNVLEEGFSTRRDLCEKPVNE